MIRLIDSIPWVRCASGNVSQLFPNSCSTLFSTFFQLFLNFFNILPTCFQHFLNLCSNFYFQLIFNFFSTFFKFYTEGLALVPILATRWRYLNWLPMWPPVDTTCISCRFGQQLALLESIASLATKWCHLH